jgi:hypothetical protein
MAKVLFSQAEIAALVSHDKQALYDAITYLAEFGKLRKGHDEKFADAAYIISEHGDLDNETIKYFIRLTPYDGRVFITLYHRQLTEYLSDKYGNQFWRKLIEKKLADMPDRIFEKRVSERWVRQGQNRLDASNGVGGILRYQLAGETPDSLKLKADEDKKVIRKYEKRKTEFYAQQAE